MAGDAPIQGRAEDRLDRARFADSVAEALRGLDASGGAVAALFGPWGIGKTSVLNMVSEALCQEPPLDVVQFNPWLFSGTDQLLVEFFTELAAQLRLKPNKRGKIADLLDAYGEGLASLKAVPVIGPWAGIAGGGSKFAGHLIKRKAKDGLIAQRVQLQAALARLDRAIVVVIDDIDRLQPKEVLDILRLVRLTGNFPKLIYLLAFDRSRVELILNRQDFEGGPYLEKIVEYAYDVPAIPPARLRNLLIEGIDSRCVGSFGIDGAGRWQDIFYRVVAPLFDSLRDVKRYLAVLPTVLRTVGDEVAIVDVLALEAVRVVLPDTYASLIGLGGRLAGPTRDIGSDDVKAAIDQTVEFASPHSDAIRDLCRLLFPGTDWLFGGPAYGREYLQHWRRERRVASPEVFSYYLTRTLEPGTASAGLVASAFATLGDRDSLCALLDGINADTLEDLLSRLEAYEDEFSEDAVEPAVEALLDLCGRLPSRSGALIGSHTTLNRVILRLLQRIPDRGVLTETVVRLFEDTPTLQAKFRLMRLVGHLPNAGHRLIPKPDAERLEKSLHHMLLHADADLLHAERELLLMLKSAVQANPDDRKDLDRELQDPRLIQVLIADALDEVRTQPFGSFNVRAQEVLDWEALLTVFGTQEAIASAIEDLHNASPAEDSYSTSGKALALVRRYLSGWRPDTTSLPPVLNKAAAQSGPRSLLRPEVAGLVIRAVARHRLDAARAEHFSLASSYVHSRMRAVLAAAPVLDAIDALARARGLSVAQGEWRAGPDQEQNAKTATEIVDLATNGSPADLQARCAMIMPGLTDSELRVFVEILIAGGPGTEVLAALDTASFLPLIVSEVRDLVSAELRTIEIVGSRCLREVVGAPSPPRIGIETHLAVLAATSTDKAALKGGKRLADYIDLTSLGKFIVGDRRQEGAFASNDEWNLRDPAEVDRLTVAAITSIARDWGILSIDEVLPEALANAR